MALVAPPHTHWLVSHLLGRSLLWLPALLLLASLAPARATDEPVSVRCAVLSAATRDGVTAGELEINVANLGGALDAVQLDLDRLPNVRLPEGSVALGALAVGERVNLVVRYARDNAGPFQPVLQWQLSARDAAGAPVVAEVSSPVDNREVAP